MQDEVKVTQADREAATLAWLDKQIAFYMGLLAKADTETHHFEKLVEEGHECWASSVRVWRKYANDHRDKLSIYTTIRDTFVDRDEWRTQHENLLSIYQSELARHQAERETLARMEPVAWMYERKGKVRIDHSPTCSEDMTGGWAATPLYALPPAPEAGQ